MPQPGSLPCLTVHQMWAWAIAENLKPFENRGWSRNYRGPLLIHAGRSRASLDESRRHLERLGIVPPRVEDLPFGAIVAVTNVVGYSPIEEVAGQPFAEGPICWRLEDSRHIRSFPYPGQQGLFQVPVDIVSRLVEIESPLPDWTPGVLPLH